MILTSKELFFMKSIKISALVIGLVSSFTITADDHSDAYWLMRARDCAEEKMIITEHIELEVKNFAVKDENGKNIYQVALENHKQKGSIPCARLALSLEVELQKLRKKLEDQRKIVDDQIKILDEAEETFETPHR